MTLAALILILLFGGMLAGVIERRFQGSAKWISLFSVLLVIGLLVQIWFAHSKKIVLNSADNMYLVLKEPWIPEFGIELHLELDGLGLIMVSLTGFLALIAVLVSWNEVTKRVGFYYFNLLWTLAGIMGVFLAFDLFLFYLFWEVMLVPMYFLISIWGHTNRIYAAYKFFIFTQVGGLLMLLSLLGLYFFHGSETGVYTFDYWALLETSLGPAQASWLMFGFLMAFFIKLPVLPFHNWLPDAHGEAPTAGSVILAGLLLKTGAYGLLRFILPFFPQAAASFAMPAMVLGVCGILYGAKLAFAQTDIKRLVAYTSVSHMGFVVIGIFSFNVLAIQGVIMQLVAHGLSTGALFVLAGILYQRTGTRDIEKMSGLWANVPRMGVTGLILVLASLGLPGLANFVAEFMILAGTFTVSKVVTVIAAFGLIAAAIYSLRIMQKVFFGAEKSPAKIKDLSSLETVIIATIIFFLVYLGLYPSPITDITNPSVRKILSKTEQVQTGKPYQVFIEEKKSINAHGKY